MDPVSDLWIGIRSDVEKLQMENRYLKWKVMCLEIVSILLVLISFLLCFLFLNAHKYGYEAATKDVYTSSMKTDYVDGKVVWK